MENLWDEIGEIVQDESTRQLAQSLCRSLKEVSWPTEEGKQLLTAILQDVAEELPRERAMWMAFWLGAAWEKASVVEFREGGKVD